MSKTYIRLSFMASGWTGKHKMNKGNEENLPYNLKWYNENTQSEKIPEHKFLETIQDI